MLAHTQSDVRNAKRVPDPIDIAVGERIRCFRRASHMSQEALALAIGVTFQQVQKYERGKNRISASMMARVAHTLVCSAADLMGETEFAEMNSPVAELNFGFRQLQHHEREAVLMLVRSLARLS